MEYSYKFRIYPTKEQMAQIQRTFGCLQSELMLTRQLKRPLTTTLVPLI